MSYTITKTVSDADFETVEARTRDALSESGFGVLTEIDVAETMNEKLGEKMDRYTILGACNPKLAFGAIQTEPRVGAMLPCNVIVRQLPESVEVSAVDPVASMSAIDNPELSNLAGQVRYLLADAIERI